MHSSLLNRVVSTFRWTSPRDDSGAADRNGGCTVQPSQGQARRESHAEGHPRRLMSP